MYKEEKQAETAKLVYEGLCVKQTLMLKLGFWWALRLCLAIFIIMAYAANLIAVDTSALSLKWHQEIKLAMIYPFGSVCDLRQLGNGSASISLAHLRAQPALEERVGLGFHPFSSREKRLHGEDAVLVGAQVELALSKPLICGVSSPAFIQALGEHLKLRQQVIATATVYFKRFYARYSLKSIDPVLMAPTCVFLASKVEILECEFYLLELMDCCLIVYHPYRPLLQYVQDMGQEDMLLPLAWRIVNDTYRTDLCLLYPPFMIALACLHVACVVQQKDARQWFAELSVDMEKILEIIRVILKLYEQWKNFDERKEMATILSKMPKPKPPPNSEGEQGPNGSQNSSYSQS
ncbi:hypothetical protein llap_12421 [Limosa lapponica baueri]|uniref:Cyclin-like domain-containing protein n=1 Tax=Limosa lapponica baueri TaxID=1758121 RepID=A0A2I0TU17_LIMLA|nr:hypothetical protein llap_12421 [Limosa lapponica baueri]